MKEVVFWGATGQAKVVRDCIRGRDIELIAIFDNDKDCVPPFGDIPLYIGKGGFETWIDSRNRHEPLGCLVTIGGDKGEARFNIQNYLEDRGCQPIIAKHYSSVVSHGVSLGWGTQVLARATICVETVIGQACIINTGAIVDHECDIGIGVHIGPGSHLAGCVSVEDFATVYTGAVVLPWIRIGKGAVVAAGAVVRDDVPPLTVVAGNPARPIRGVVA